MGEKVWLITGVSRGFGRTWAEAALERGDRVAGTARDLAGIEDLGKRFGDAFLALELDVDDRTADRDAVIAAHSHFERLDVVVNNAGYGHFGFVEELTEEEARRQMETNFFGALWVSQAAIPLMREQGSGHIVQVSSIAGLTSFPGLGVYNASKWALEGLSEAMHLELKKFGIAVTLIEPGGYATDWAGDSAAHSEPIEVYESFREARKEAWSTELPEAADTVDALMAVVDSDDPPLRLLLSSMAYEAAQGTYTRRVAEWESWESHSRGAE